ncbi:hypothetical protein AB1N83_004649 [Pleurotus pulmonarius]
MPGSHGDHMGSSGSYRGSVFFSVVTRSNEASASPYAIMPAWDQEEDNANIYTSGNVYPLRVPMIQGIIFAILRLLLSMDSICPCGSIMSVRGCGATFFEFIQVLRLVKVPSVGWIRDLLETGINRNANKLGSLATKVHPLAQMRNQMNTRS